MIKKPSDSSRDIIVNRIVATERAQALLKELTELHGELLFHQSGGCCDGSAPMCFMKDEFMIDDNDVYLGCMGVIPFYMSSDQFEYWRHTQLTLDVTSGRGASFSLESPTGFRFIIQSRLLTEEEMPFLAPIRRGI